MMIPKRRLLTLMFACLCFKKSFLLNILNELRQKLEPAIILKLLTCQRITSKNTRPSMGRHLSPRYGQVILVSRYPVLTAVNWSQHWCTMCVQYQSSCASKLARVTLVALWCGRTGGRCTVTWLPNFLGWVDLLTHGALLARFTHRAPPLSRL